MPRVLFLANNAGGLYGFRAEFLAALVANINANIKLIHLNDKR